jgi:hypothetical protein
MPIGSHVIPRFYLEQFASAPARKGKPGRVWVYQRGKKPQQRATSVQGRENGYFGFVRPDGTLEESLETRLAKLEKASHDTLVCAKSELFCWSSTHRNNLAFYTSLLFQRATQSRNVNMKHWDGIQKGFAEAVADDKFIDDLAVHYSAKFNKEITREELRRLRRALPVSRVSPARSIVPPGVPALPSDALPLPRCPRRPAPPRRCPSPTRFRFP